MMDKQKADAYDPLYSDGPDYDDRDYAAEDRDACLVQGHPFSYVGSFGPSCECGNRSGDYGADFTPDEIARGTLALMIYRHDKEPQS